MTEPKQPVAKNGRGKVDSRLAQDSYIYLTPPQSLIHGLPMVCTHSAAVLDFHLYLTLFVRYQTISIVMSHGFVIKQLTGVGSSPSNLMSQVPLRLSHAASPYPVAYCDTIDTL